jgi:hypothetical protein
MTFFISKLAGCRRRPQRVESASRSDDAEAEERRQIKANGRNERRLDLFRFLSEKSPREFLQFRMTALMGDSRQTAEIPAKVDRS